MQSCNGSTPNELSGLVLIFLARGVGAGKSAAEAFFESYRRHPAGHAHSLLVLTKGWEHETGLADVVRWTRELGGETLALPDDGFDLAAYFRAAAQASAHWICCLNSNSRIQADDWLGLLYAAASSPGVGAAAATASWESAFRNVRSMGPGRGIYQYSRYGLRLAYNALKYRDFPNPHLRSNAFVMRRALFLEFAATCRLPRHKRDAQALESGRNGLSQFLRRRGLKLLVADATGRTFTEEEWPRSGVFRAQDQKNLLVGDNQTRGFAVADANARSALARAAWGSEIPPSDAP